MVDGIDLENVLSEEELRRLARRTPADQGSGTALPSQPNTPLNYDLTYPNLHYGTRDGTLVDDRIDFQPVDTPPAEEPGHATDVPTFARPAIQPLDSHHLDDSSGVHVSGSRASVDIAALDVAASRPDAQATASSFTHATAIAPHAASAAPTAPIIASNATQSLLFEPATLGGHETGGRLSDPNTHAPVTLSAITLASGGAIAENAA